jgi:hypothetical protein
LTGFAALNFAMTAMRTGQSIGMVASNALAILLLLRRWKAAMSRPPVARCHYQFVPASSQPQGGHVSAMLQRRLSAHRHQTGTLSITSRAWQVVCVFFQQ